MGNLEAAERWVRGSGLSANDTLGFRQELGHMGLARVALASGREAEGLALLSRLGRAAEAGGRLGRLAEIRRLSHQARLSQNEVLSERELEIIRLIAEGCSNQEIASVLVLAVGTVKVHVHNLFRKLGVQSRTQAVSRARELRLLK
jgi:LuxR family maltose regulon positive regulatory protein